MSDKNKFFFDIEKDVVDISHGGGGLAMNQLIDSMFIDAFANEWLNKKNDQACFEVSKGRMVITTDGHVVTPLFFPGGDIGTLAVNGTVNDVAMAGAKPLYLTAGFILEEGFRLKDLHRVVESMASTSRQIGVSIVTGDTKVVEQGKGDGIYITTTGVGVVPEGIEVSVERVRPGDMILLSGCLGDHGVAIMSQRENLSFETELKSDSASLHDLVATMVNAVSNIHCLRDPTRGGLAASLNEIATQASVGISIKEKAIPVKPEVAAACEILGLDPLTIANEGKLIAFCEQKDAERLLSTMKEQPLGRDSAIIGQVVEDSRCFVQMETVFGGKRVVAWLSSEQLPRIC